MSTAVVVFEVQMPLTRVVQRNCIGPEGIVAVAEALQENDSLTSLDLSVCVYVAQEG